MAASLTLGSAALAADGKTLTATISGGTGTGYSLGSSAGIIPHFSASNPYQQWQFAIASSSVVGTTLTLNLASSVGSGEVFRLDIASGTTLTDSGANTPTGQTNIVVTNNSTVTVRYLDPTTDQASFEYNGQYVSTPFRTSGSKANGVDCYAVEFVTDATEVTLLSLQSVAASVSVDGAAATTPGSNPSGSWVTKLLASGLAAGKHLFLLNYNDYFYGIRLVGGTRSMYTVPKTKRTLLANTGLVDKPTSTPVSVSGTAKVQTAAVGDAASDSYHSFTLEVGFTGTGLELETVAATNTGWAASIDGGYAGAVIPGGDAGVNNTNGVSTLAKGLSNAAHTIRATQIGAGVSTQHRAVKVIVGTVVPGTLAISDTSITVSDASSIAINDWVRIDDFSKREWRQVTNIVGNVLTVAALSQAHAAGAQVVSYSAPAGSFTTYTSRSTTRKVAAIGDSNTQGANDAGFAGTPDSNGVYYSFYDPRRAAIWLAVKDLDIDLMNFGIQGTTSATQSTQASSAAGGYKPAAGWDAVTIETGTNDINGTAITPATFQTQVQSLVTTMKAALKPGGLIHLLPPATPSTTNAGGLNISTVRTALAAIAAADPTVVLYHPDYTLPLVAGDVSGTLHYKDSGITKRAQQGQHVIAGGPKGLLVAG